MTKAVYKYRIKISKPRPAWFCSLIAHVPRETLIRVDDLFQLEHGSVKTLSLREHQVLRLRYGLNKQRKKHTFQQIADFLRLSRERIRQIQEKASRKLQKRTLYMK